MLRGEWLLVVFCVALCACTLRDVAYMQEGGARQNAGPQQLGGAAGQGAAGGPHAVGAAGDGGASGGAGGAGASAGTAGASGAAPVEVGPSYPGLPASFASKGVAPKVILYQSQTEWVSAPELSPEPVFLWKSFEPGGTFTLRPTVPGPIRLEGASAVFLVRSKAGSTVKPFARITANQGWTDAGLVKIGKEWTSIRFNFDDPAYVGSGWAPNKTRELGLMFETGDPEIYVHRVWLEANSAPPAEAALP